MYYVLVAAYVLVCLVLSMVILRRRDAAEISPAHLATAAARRRSALIGCDAVDKATSIAAVLFMLFALTLSVLGQRGGSQSILSGTPAPAPATTKPAPAAPASTTPAPVAPTPAPAK
jgi:preprotein translocase subunit SecG